MAETKEKKKGILGWYFQTNLLARILVGLVLGAVVGIVLGFFPDSVNPSSTIPSSSETFSSGC